MREGLGNFYHPEPLDTRDNEADRVLLHTPQPSAAPTTNSRSPITNPSRVNSPTRSLVEAAQHHCHHPRPRVATSIANSRVKPSSCYSGSIVVLPNPMQRLKTTRQAWWRLGLPAALFDQLVHHFVDGLQRDRDDFVDIALGAAHRRCKAKGVLVRHRPRDHAVLQTPG